MYLIYFIDDYGVTWYLKSSRLNFNWTTAKSKAKRFKKEATARNILRELYFTYMSLYKVMYVAK